MAAAGRLQLRTAAGVGAAGLSACLVTHLLTYISAWLHYIPYDRHSLVRAAGYQWRRRTGREGYPTVAAGDEHRDQLEWALEAGAHSGPEQ